MLKIDGMRLVFRDDKSVTPELNDEQLTFVRKWVSDMKKVLAGQKCS